MTAPKKIDKILSPIKKRIFEYLKEKGISKEFFYAESGISASNFKGKGGESELGGEKIVKILTIYSDLNAEWLMTGEGEIFKTKTTHNVTILKGDSKGDSKGDKRKLHKTSPFGDEYSGANLVSIVSDRTAADTADVTSIPIVDISVAAGGGAFNHDHLAPEDSIALPSHMVRRGLHHCVKIKGDSMAPTMQDGGYIIMRLLDPSEWADIKNEYVYVVTDREGKTYIKRLRNRLYEHGFIVCTSDNPDKNTYRNFNLSEDEIANVWYVEWYLTAKMPNIHATYYDQVQSLRDDMDEVKDFLAHHFKKPLKGK